MHILITGGTGFIGNELRQILLQQGHYVIIITRWPNRYESETAQNQQFIDWESDLVSAMEKADAVINLAGETLFGQHWTEETRRKIYSSRVENTRKLVQAIKKAKNPPEVMVSGSAVGYYGDRGHTILDEEDPAGEGFLSEVCVAWEDEAKKAKEAGTRVAVPRMATVLEQGGGALQKMLPAYKLYIGGPLGNGDQFLPWIHRHDLCRGLLYPLEHKTFEGTYNLSAPNPVTMEEFANTLGGVLNRPSFFRVPGFVLNLILGEAAGPVLDSIRVQPKHLQQAGFEFKFEEIQEAMSDIF